MVKHTHQDFLHDVSDADVPELANSRQSQVPELAFIRDASQEKDLFDYEGYFRKMSLSYLDEHIDDREDWNLMVGPLRGINCLYLIDDRIVINPIMADYARMKNCQYLRQFARDGVCAVIVSN